MDNTPNLLCLGELCRDQGCAFSWQPYQEVPDFHRPDGTPVEVQVDANVPTIAGGALSAQTRGPVQGPVGIIHKFLFAVVALCLVN